MALSYYGVDATVVSKRVPQLHVQGGTVPGTADITAGGQFIDEAAATLADALSKGGFGLSVSCSASSHQETYVILRSLLAERAALLWIQGIFGIGPEENDESSKRWAQNRAAFEAIKDGNAVGDVSPGSTSSNKVGRLSLGTDGDTTDDLDARRFRATDQL